MKNNTTYVPDLVNEGYLGQATEAVEEVKKKPSPILVLAGMGLAFAILIGPGSKWVKGN